MLSQDTNIMHSLYYLVVDKCEAKDDVLFSVAVKCGTPRE